MVQADKSVLSTSGLWGELPAPGIRFWGVNHRKGVLAVSLPLKIKEGKGRMHRCTYIMIWKLWKQARSKGTKILPGWDWMLYFHSLIPTYEVRPLWCFSPSFSYPCPALMADCSLRLGCCPQLRSHWRLEAATRAQRLQDESEMLWEKCPEE